MNGFGLEFYIETPAHEIADSAEDIKRSWQFQLLYTVSQLAAGIPWQSCCCMLLQQPAEHCTAAHMLAKTDKTSGMCCHANQHQASAMQGTAASDPS